MNQEKYERTQMQVTEFKSEDVITTSSIFDNDEYEDDKMPIIPTH